MKKIEVIVVSREIIKPSSPTPDFLRKHKLSYIDQKAPPFYMPLIFFYSNPGDRVETSNRLKKSLSEALNQFYPLGGKLVDCLYVDCNDDGVEFLEAEADVDLSDILSNPVPDELDQFLPQEPNNLTDFCMAVQISFLNCGSMAVGLMISHKIADAISLCNFASTWAAINARGAVTTSFEQGLTLYPNFEAANLFPPIEKDLLLLDESNDLVMFKEKPLIKLLRFPNSKINALRDKYYVNGGKLRPTRVEALATFIWSRFMASTQTKPNSDKILRSSILAIVNLRPRINPPALSYFGNIWCVTGASVEIKDNNYEKESFQVVEKLREAISSINGDYVAKLQKGYVSAGRPNKVVDSEEEEEEPVRFGFTSLCRFPLYELDFGWGKPVWVAAARWGLSNVVAFLDSPSGDGIEAWVKLNKEDLSKFEQDEVLLEFVSSIV